MEILSDVLESALEELSTFSRQQFQQLEKDGLVFEIEGLVCEIDLAMTDHENSQRRKTVIEIIQHLRDGSYTDNIEKTLLEMFPKTTQLIVGRLEQIQITNDLDGEER